MKIFFGVSRYSIDRRGNDIIRDEEIKLPSLVKLSNRGDK